MKGEKIQLRALEPDDVDVLYRWENDQSMWRVGNTITPFSRFDIEQYVLNSDKDIFANRQLRLMIDKLPDETTIGAIDLFDFDPLHKRVCIGILIDVEAQGNGFASEALGLVIDYCFKTLMVHQLYANITPDNLKSIQLFESKNFKLAVSKKDWLHIENKWVDELLYQLINPYQ